MAPRRIKKPKRVPPPNGDPDQLLTPEETASMLRCALSSLARWRWNGEGPHFVKVGGNVRYRRKDLRDWLDERSRSSTTKKPA
jgi:predicted DNA-binding transcriptional regulator AlpA